MFKEGFGEAQELYKLDPLKSRDTKLTMSRMLDRRPMVTSRHITRNLPIIQPVHTITNAKACKIPVILD